jgi:hypothetical protein
MEQSMEQIFGHSCAVQYFVESDGWRCEITSVDQKTTGDGRGETKAQAYKAAVLDFEGKLP